MLHVLNGGKIVFIITLMELIDDELWDLVEEGVSI
jgi:hypothetical protein